MEGKVTVVVGAQWGDEGKGKLTTHLSQQADLCCRYNGGANNCHTAVLSKGKMAETGNFFVKLTRPIRGEGDGPTSPALKACLMDVPDFNTVQFRILPTGVLSPSTTNYLGNGMVVHLPTLKKEIESLTSYDPKIKNRVFISSRAHLVFDCHMEMDGQFDSSVQIGTTKRGIGPTYSTKAIRNGIRVGDLLHWEQFEITFRELVDSFQRHGEFAYDVEAELKLYKEFAEYFKPMMVEGVTWVKNHLDNAKTIVCECANSTMNDIDFGMYPYVTSSSTTVGGAITGMPMPWNAVGNVIGVVKAYMTRVRAGQFPTEIDDESIVDKIGYDGYEFANTTGKARRVGWIDIPVIRYANMLNGFDSLHVTKLYALAGVKEIKICTGYQRTGPGYPGGEMLSEGSYPTDYEEMSTYSPVYETMPGWPDSLDNIDCVEVLPTALLNYLKRIQDLTGVKVASISLPQVEVLPISL